MKKLKVKDRKRIENAIRDLNEVIKDIKMYIPDANYYVSGECKTSLNLMTEPFDVYDMNNRKWKDSNVLSIEIYNCDCGGF